MTALRAELRAALTARKTSVRAARDGVSYAAMNVFSRSGGDAGELLASGLELELPKRPVGAPAAPGNVRAGALDHEGEVRLQWQRPVRRCTFEIEMTRDRAAERGWKPAAICIQQTCVVKNLESGEKYWFRIAAINAHGRGPWSQPASVRVK